MSMGGDFAEIYAERIESVRIPLEENKVQAAEIRQTLGAGIRVLHGEQQGYAYSDDLSLEHLLEAARVAAHIAQGGKSDMPVSVARGVTPDFYPLRVPFSEVAVKDKVQLVQRANSAAYDFDDRVQQVSIGYLESNKEILIANTDGTYVNDYQPMIRFHVSVMAAVGSDAQTGFYGGGGRIGMEWFERNSPECIACEAARQALVQIGADEAPAGAMPVVIDNAWGGVWLHEAVGHGLEGDFNRKQTSIYTGRVGETVASELCTVVDDATVTNARGSLNIDDEGTAGQKKVLIENGRLTGYMQDRLNAQLMNSARTGSGRRQSYKHIPMPRMTNTFLANGNHDREEIIGSVQRGFYAKHFSGGQVDISNGNYVFNVTEGYMIENGKIGRPVRGATLIGNGPNDLTRVSMVGNNMQLDPGIGMCGKDGQSVPVGVGMPTILISEMTVGGTSVR
jgi:TldD protein